MKTLDQLAAGEIAVVEKIGGKGPVRRRLMDMGLVKGTAIKMVKTSPLGDPVEYELRGYNLSLRKEEAKMIKIS